MRNLKTRLEFGAARAIQFVRLAQRRTDPHVAAARKQRAEFYKRIWAEAARAAGAEMRPIEGTCFEIRRGLQRTVVDQNYTAMDDPVTLRLAGDKSLVHNLLHELDVPVPDHLVFTERTLDTALQFLRDAGGPCVVKPQRDTGAGQGVTTGIRTPRQLLWAAATAAAFRKGLLLEKQVTGRNYRLLFMDGEILDVVRRDPPCVVGDGKSSVRELMATANRARLREGVARAQTLLNEDRATMHTLAAQGLTSRSVPEPGRKVQVSDVINDNQACENVEASAEVCPAIVAIAARASLAIGVRLAGVDVITPDSSQALEANGGAVLEVNTTPGFHMHYYRRGEPCRVAEHVLLRLLQDDTELANRRSGARVDAR